MLFLILEESNRMRRTRDLFKKIGDIKGTFHAKMGTIKDRNDKDLTEANILRRGGKNTQKNYTKKFFFFFFLMSDLIYLFTLRTSHFWLDSEVEALREDSLHLLAICSCCFSLASFILLAKSLAYSAASSLFFLVSVSSEQYVGVCAAELLESRDTESWVL